MATIKFKRGSGQPTGLTAYEPAWDTTNNRFFINNGATALWIGAKVDNDNTLGGAGSSGFVIPTQLAVKTYVDNQVISGISGSAVTGVNGLTGNVTIFGSTGINVSAAGKGVTVSVSSIVALTNKVNTFTDSQNIQGAGVNLQVTDSSTSDYILLDPNSNSINFFDNGSTSLVTLKAVTGGFANQTITFPNETGTIALRGVAQTFSGLQTFSSGISSFGITTGNIRSNNGQNLLLSSTNTASAQLTLTGSATEAGTVLSVKAKTINFGYSGVTAALSFNDGSGAIGTITTLTPYTTNREYYLPDASGTFVLNTTAVTSVDGVTAAVDLRAGSGIQIVNPTGNDKGITFNNTGVLSFNGSTGTVQGVSSILAGTAIQISGSTGNVTLTNIGVQSLSGTANQITVGTGTTGALTVSLPSAITTPGSLTVTGNLVVNGTTTTVNSTTVTVQDPIINIGGYTGGIAPGVTGDVKDRGIAFQYNSGTTSATGYFGYDQSKQRFIFIQGGADITNEVVTGNAGSAEFSGVVAPQGTLTLIGQCGSNSTILVNGAATSPLTTINYTSAEHIFSGNGISGGVISLASDPVTVGSKASIYPATTTFAGTRNFTLPDWSGGLVAATTSGGTSDWLIRGTGTSTAPTWINPNAQGFTAFRANGAVTSFIQGFKSGGTFGLVFASGTGYANLYTDSSNDISWNPTTITLTIGNGLGKVEAIVDGGAFV